MPFKPMLFQIWKRIATIFQENVSLKTEGESTYTFEVNEGDNLLQVIFHIWKDHT